MGLFGEDKNSKALQKKSDAAKSTFKDMQIKLKQVNKDVEAEILARKAVIQSNQVELKKLEALKLENEETLERLEEFVK